MYVHHHQDRGKTHLTKNEYTQQENDITSKETTPLHYDIPQR